MSSGTDRNNSWFFDVDERGVIVEPDVSSPKVNEDVYDCISVSRIKDAKALIGEVDQYDELRSHFQFLYASHVDKQQARLEGEIATLKAQLDEAPEASVKSKTLLERISRARNSMAALDPDADDGWKTWIQRSGPSELDRFKGEVDTWLKSPVDWLASESWPEDWSGQGRALSFFRDQTFATLEALGVVIIEGHFPGSSYYAAELKGSIDQANAAAARLELPFRFRRVTK